MPFIAALYLLGLAWASRLLFWPTISCSSFLADDASMTESTPQPSPDPNSGLTLTPPPSSSMGNLIGRVAKIAAQARERVTETGGSLTGTVREGAVETATKAGNLARQAGGLVKNTAGTVQGTAHQMTGVVGSAIGGGMNQANQAATQATKYAGQALRLINDNPLLKKTTGLVRADWILSIVDQVDVEKAAADVARLQAAYPNESPQQLAHRIMVQKTLYAGGLGLASSLLPGAAAALFAVDLTATVLLQAEMVYQIARVYGLDLADPARQGEVLAIFGLSMGGQKAMQTGMTYAAKAGLTVFESIPVAGAVIGASSNAVLNYAIGYAACRFYETQLNGAVASPLESEAALVAAEAEGEQFLAAALEQQRILDQVLAHAVVAAYPAEQWQDIVPDLEQLKLDRNSLEAIANHLQSPESLDTLLPQLKPDFALPLLAQCQRIAELDQVITPAEQALLDQLTTRQGELLA